MLFMRSPALAKGISVTAEQHTQQKQEVHWIRPVWVEPKLTQSGFWEQYRHNCNIARNSHYYSLRCTCVRDLQIISSW